MDEMPDTDARLQKLLEKRGQELVRGLIEEFRALNREIALLKSELSALSDYHAARDRLLMIEAAAAKIVRLPSVVTIEADQNLRFQDGFYALEHTADGTPFRWTGPSPQFSFDVFVDRRDPVQVKLDALTCIDFESQKNISLFADGQSVPVRVEPADYGFEAIAILPPRVGSEVTNLVFMLPASLVPPGSDDTRSLGLAFWRFSATALGSEAARTESVSPDMVSVAGVGEVKEFGLSKSAAAE